MILHMSMYLSAAVALGSSWLERPSSASKKYEYLQRRSSEPHKARQEKGNARSLVILVLGV